MSDREKPRRNQRQNHNLSQSRKARQENKLGSSLRLRAFA
jgi:hypothetical protein